MNSLTYSAVNWLPLAVACIALAALVSGWLFIFRSSSTMSRGLRMALWAARVVVATLLLAFTLDFRQEQSRKTTEKPMLGVVIDRSSSMAVKDAPGGASRIDAARGHVQQEIRNAWGAQSERMDVSFAGSSLSQGDLATTTADDSRSALGKSLGEALERTGRQPLDGLVLFSDGAASDEAQVAAAAKLYREARVPIYPWLMGTTRQPADLRIVAASLRQPSPSQPQLHLDLTFESPGYDGKDTTLLVRFDQQHLCEQKIHLNGKRQKLGIDFNSPFRGLQFYDVELSSMDGEGFTDNNHVRLASDLRREPIRVMYMEGSAPSEIHYLREAVEADPEMEIDCMDSLLDEGGSYAYQRGLLQSDPSQGIQKNQGYKDQAGRDISGVRNTIHGYPKNIDGLLQYDVIINSDIAKELFTDDQLKNTVDFVEKHGGGFVMVGGFAAFGSGGYDKTVIDKLMPVEIGGESSFLSTTFKAKVTDAGWTHPIMQVGDNHDETQAAWTKHFPGFYGANGAKRAKPGAHVIARADSSYAADNNSVLFAVQQIGRGRTMAFMSDTTESWGTAFETVWGPTHRDSKYYRKFWNNIIRWLAAERIARKGGDATIQIPDQPVSVGDTIPVQVTSLSGNDLAGLTLTVKEGDADEAALPLRWDAAKRVWETSLIARNPGELRFEAKYSNVEGKPVSAKTGLNVRSFNDETVAIAARQDLMADLARRTGGKVLTDENAAQTLNEIASRSVPTVWKGSFPVWDRWWVMLPVLALTGFEWLLRRKRGTRITV